MTTQSKKPLPGSIQAEPDPVMPEPYGPIVLRLAPVVPMTDAQFYEMCALNRDIRIERNAQGELELMPPTVGITGNRNARIIIDLGIWARSDGRGEVFDSSTGFRLPNGSVRAPDAAWLLKERWSELTDEEKDDFIRISPDFVIELLSKSDRLRVVQDKMEEYLENGVRLGWLIDPSQGMAYVYRINLPVEELHLPEYLSGNPELPAFTLDLKPIWEPQP